MKNNNYQPIISVWLFFLVAAARVLGQASAPADPFQQEVAVLSLDGLTLADALARLSQTTAVAYSVEFPLGKAIDEASPPLKTIVASVGPGQVPAVLNRLCELDTTFTWRRIGTTANLFPRALENDPSYLLNRRVATLNFSDVHDAQSAVFESVRQLSGPREQIAMLESGTSVTFAKPWTATFTDISIREAFDEIARQLGPTY